KSIDAINTSSTKEKDSLLLANKAELNSANPTLPSLEEAPSITQLQKIPATKTTNKTDTTAQKAEFRLNTATPSELFPSVLLAGIESRKLKKQVETKLFTSGTYTSTQFNKLLA